MKTIRLPFRLKRPALACGADMEGAFAIAVGDEVYLKDGFGDLSDAGNLARYEKSVTSSMKKLKVSPRIVICDMHPGYFSTRFARQLAVKARLYKVQHHEAHVASAMIENSVKGDVIGVAFDGTGFGTDGRIWGGEFITGRPRKFRRAAHMEYIHMPGADAAVKEPWRMASSYLYKAFGNGFLKHAEDPGKALFIKTMIDKSINSPLSSSIGRFFDASASLILGKSKSEFEAQLPMALERIAPSMGYEERYDFEIKKGGNVFVIYTAGVIRGIVKDIARGVDKRLLSGKFHNTVVGIVKHTAMKLREIYGIDNVVLTGGVFQNKFLAMKTCRVLEGDGFKVYTHSGVSVTDSGIPVGQIAIAYSRGVCV